MIRVFKTLAVFTCVSFLFSGCAYLEKMKKGKFWTKGKKSRKASSSRSGKGSSPARPQTASDPAAQQRYYDMGMRYYSEEKYAEAKKAWQQAIQYGPRTPLASKAQEYLKKTEQVLKTLQELEKR